MPTLYEGTGMHATRNMEQAVFLSTRVSGWEVSCDTEVWGPHTDKGTSGFAWQTLGTGCCRAAIQHDDFEMTGVGARPGSGLCHAHDVEHVPELPRTSASPIWKSGLQIRPHVQTPWENEQLA